MCLVSSERLVSGKGTFATSKRSSLKYFAEDECRICILLLRACS